MKEENHLEKRQQFWRIMELPELSLAPSADHKSTNSSSSESETNLYPCKKRKFPDDGLFNKINLNGHDPIIQTGTVDLQLKDPLPLDWEQCLDLESGRMYYLNRKTLRRSWSCPKEHNHQQKLDLELNISTTVLSEYPERVQEMNIIDQSKKHQNKYSSSSNNNNMVALACLNCHLLVILSKSSPSCPNCKYVHSLPAQQIPTTKPPTPIKSLDTLSLLN